METAETKTLSVDIKESYDSARAIHDRSNWTHRIVLVPEDAPRVEVWSTYGNGMPVDLWHNRAISLGKIPDGTADTSAYVAAVREHEDLLLELASLHDTRWDGHNTVGFFTDIRRYAEIEQALDLVFDAASLDAPMFWDVGDWFLGTSPSDFFPDSFDGSDEAFEKLATELVNNAVFENAHLDQAAVVKHLRDWHQLRLEEDGD